MCQIDPGFPRERLDFMLEDSKARVVATTTRLAEKFAASNVRVVCIDEVLEAGIERGARNPQIPVTAEDDALRSLHVRFDWQTQGYRDFASLICESAERDALRDFIHQR